MAGREASTGRKVAIKKIKVGQFKDGLDMSAIREVKYLRELKHQNVIEVRVRFLTHIPLVSLSLSLSLSLTLNFENSGFVNYSFWMSSPQKQT